MKQPIFLFLLLMLIFSCRKSYDCNMKDEITYENIPDSNISQIPYKGNELLSFVNETGDTAVFKCTGYNNYYDESYYWNGNPDCQWKSITKTQQIDFTFIDTANDYRNFRVRYEAVYESLSRKTFTSVLFFNPKDLYKTQRSFVFFFNPLNSDSIILPNSKVIYGSFFENDKYIFYSLNKGIISFEDKFQNKWIILN
jgi:hypothetical protein